MAGYYREFHNSVGVFIFKTPVITWLLPVTTLRDKLLFIPLSIDKHELIQLVFGNVIMEPQTHKHPQIKLDIT